MPGLLLLAGTLLFVALYSARWVRRGPAAQYGLRVILAGVWAACASFLVASLLTPVSPPSRLLFWCLLAVLMSPLSARQPLTHPGWRRLIGVMALVLGIAGVAIAASGILADASAATGADTSRSPSVRAEAADNAVAVNPLPAEYWIVAVDARTNLVPATGLAEPGRKNPEFDRALLAAEKAVELEPSNPYRKAALVATLLVGGQDVDPRHAAAAVTVAEEAMSQLPTTSTSLTGTRGRSGMWAGMPKPSPCSKTRLPSVRDSDGGHTA